MYVHYYFLIFLQVYEGENDSFLDVTGCLSTCQLGLLKKYKIMIKNLFTLEDCNAKKVS